MDSYLERLRQAVTSAASGMTIEELTRRPEGKWSAAEVLEHLYLTYTGTQKAFERCLKAGKPLGGVPTFRQRVSTAAVTTFGYFPKGRKSPDQVFPRGQSAEKIVAEIGPQIVAMDKAIAQCEERYGSRVKSPRPPGARASDGAAVAKISPGPRTPSREANSRTKKITLTGGARFLASFARSGSLRCGLIGLREADVGRKIPKRAHVQRYR